MRFLVDENLGKRFADVLSRHGYNALFVGDMMRSAPDDKILSFAEKENLIIITDDKDFGELVFRLKRSTKGVILFRASTTDPEKLFKMSEGVLNKSKGKFVVVKEGQVRVRNLK